MRALLLAFVLLQVASPVPLKAATDSPDRSASIAQRAPSSQEGQNHADASAKPSHDWIDRLNAASTAVIAVFTALMFAAIGYQVKTSRDIERAWVMAELDWFDREKMNIGETGVVTSDETVPTTTVSPKLTCRNSGRSPAWIEGVYGRMDIFTNVATLPDQTKMPLQSFGTLEPVGPGESRFRILQELSCRGHRKAGQNLSVYVVVRYRDIFRCRRQTTLSYTIVPEGDLVRQYALPERNRNI